jgi:hypothetical protein
MQLVLATGISLSTVAKWDKGGPVSESIDRTLLRTSSELGLKPENEAEPESDD